MFQDQIPLLRPWTGEEEVQAAAEVILSGWVSQGPKVMEFENAVAGYVGSRYGVATNACTSALHLALHLSGVGPGDEVIVPSFTCMATANAVHHAGALPVFADVDARTYNLDADSAAAAITPHTRAILVVHQIGLAADMEPFVALARKHSLALVEDGACSLGASVHGKRVGAIAAPTCFSFHPRKMITTGEGGMITTNDRELAERARVLRATGASISDLERHKAKGVLVQKYGEVGYNYRMTDIQAAIGTVQMRKLDAMLAERARQARRYDAALAEIGALEPPYVPPYATHAYSSYLVRVKPGARMGRDALLRRMAERGISCRTGIQPLHQEPFYAERYAGTRFPASEAAAQATMFLPIFPGLTEEQQERVIAELAGAMG
ncbi:MAG: DegT/DnrJ/EryC1/StrS family aminotransferase [Acidobacteriia bacterium]|nr:DegT/DnrJ/EryC1/StrS family aminotransferase [Terriglobia bacterium]